VLLRWAFEEIQREEGQSVYCRLSTRAIDQPRRTIDPDLAAAIVAGAYWLREPAAGAELAIAYCGAVAPEALAADQAVAEDIPGAGLLAITSPDRLHRNWLVARVGGESSVAEGCWPGCGRVPPSSPSAISTRRPCHGSVPSPATR